MTPLVPELSTLPISGTFDGELVAFGEDGSPAFRCFANECHRRGLRVEVASLRCG
jgi:hypothetical protein